MREPWEVHENMRDCFLYRATVMGRRLLNSNSGRGRWEVENLMACTVPGAAEQKNGLTERKNGLRTCSVRQASRLWAGTMRKLAGTHGLGAGMPCMPSHPWLVEPPLRAPWDLTSAIPTRLRTKRNLFSRFW